MHETGEHGCKKGMKENRSRDLPNPRGEGVSEVWEKVTKKRARRGEGKKLEKSKWQWKEFILPVRERKSLSRMGGGVSTSTSHCECGQM